MLFKPRHIEKIRNGTKTATRRDWKDGHARPNVGAIHMAQTEMFTSIEECDCFIRIDDVYEERLGDMTAEDARKEGGYTLDDFREAWEQINGEGSFDPDQVVDVVEFTYVGREHPEQSDKQEAVDAE